MPAGIGAGVRDPVKGGDGQFLSEDIYVAKAIPKRRLEFAAGRAAGRAAMAQIGGNPVAIPMSSNRAPIWPAGFVGSISHDDRACVAVAGVADRWAAVGIDIEPDQDFDQTLVSEICTTDEQIWLRSLPIHHQLRMARTIFSVKECAYKCQFALTGEIFGFDRFETSFIDPNQSHFEVQFTRDTGCFRTGSRLNGRLVRTDAHVISFMAIAKKSI